MALPGNHGTSERKIAAILAIKELTNEGEAHCQCFWRKRSSLSALART